MVFLIVRGRDVVTGAAEWMDRGGVRGSRSPKPDHSGRDILPGSSGGGVGLAAFVTVAVLVTLKQLCVASSLSTGVRTWRSNCLLFAAQPGIAWRILSLRCEEVVGVKYSLSQQLLLLVSR